MILEQEIANAPSHALAAKFAREISGGHLKPGAKLAGLRETAQRHKVSLATVRHSFKLLAQDGFVIAQHGSGTYVNPAMKFKGTKLVALLTSYHKQDIEGYFEPLFEVANSFDALPMVCTFEDSASLPEVINKTIAREPDLLLIDVQAIEFPMDKFRKAIDGTPHCFVNRWEWHDTKPENAVMVDYATAYTQAFRMLVDKGHKRIVFAGNNQKARSFLRDRLTLSAKNAGLKFPSSELEYIGMKDNAGKPIDSNSPDLLRIFGNGKSIPTAIFAASDYVGFRIHELLRKMNSHIPEIETIGFFDTKWSKQSGREFSTFAIDYADMWKKAFSNLKNDSAHGDNVQWTIPKFVGR
ncbi:MAG: GntR family transcriptional regulator [Lentisphaerota bacterium]